MLQLQQSYHSTSAYAFESVWAASPLGEHEGEGASGQCPCRVCSESASVVQKAGHSILDGKP